tara:strand:+ start:1658 stop:2023 length:366 start_codon:yes stop_codon:yes gene_type:complete
MEIIIIILVVVLIKLRSSKGNVETLLKTKQDEYKKLLSQKKSSEVRLGQISENLAPFLKDFKYDPKKAHFMGMPIDYIIFEEDKIVFLEIKSGEARLSAKQRKIRDLIKNKKVEWDEMRIN